MNGNRQWLGDKEFRSIFPENEKMLHIMDIEIRAWSLRIVTKPITAFGNENGTIGDVSPDGGRNGVSDGWPIIRNTIRLGAEVFYIQSVFSIKRWYFAKVVDFCTIL